LLHLTGQLTARQAGDTIGADRGRAGLRQA
jgi:hypothetical protein